MTDTDDQGGIPERIAIAFTACSHAPTPAVAQLHFDTAWRDVEHHLRTIAAGVLRDRMGYTNRCNVDDVLSETAMKLWVHLRGRNALAKGGRTIGGGLVRTIVVNAGSDFASGIRKDVKNTTPLITTDDTGELIGDWLAVDEPDHDYQPLIEQLADAAETTHRKPRWAAIIRQIGRGHYRRVDIANALGENENTIRFAFMQMRRSGLFESIHPTGTTSIAVVEAMQSIMEQLALFEQPAAQPVERRRREPAARKDSNTEQKPLFERDLEAVSA